MTASDNLLPDITRPDAGTVLLNESPAHRQVEVEKTLTELEHARWPKGLLSLSAFVSTDGETVLTYTQWANGEADREFMAGLTGTEPVEYRLYRSSVGENPPVPGCVVVVSVEFDGPDQQRQQRWVDTVFDAMAGETEPHPGGISGHFHVSVDGTRVLNYAEWTNEQAHRDALERSGQGTVGSSPGWRRVQDFPGVRSGGFRRYHLLRSLSAAPSTEPSEEDEVLDSPTDWVAEHVRAYVESNGQSGHLYQGWPTLLLTTRGRKSGKLRRTALIYGQDGERYLLVGSNAGSPHHPAWYLNLVAHPDVTVQVGSDKFTARARTAGAEEKRLLWQRMTSVFPLYDTYQAQSDRDIPLVIVERDHRQGHR
ncbi:nitroreductase family deazaflavin-dependent oxidoreductase [Microtetraspora malaysiensis]|uniref:nitroreductase family deazaflavin-dependent oxidoreductase n=1 Tax=Microtetraspora malaysiensis TaxID=161358 RepID=UPI003D8EA2A6